MTRTAAAPSLVCDELPAVTVPLHVERRPQLAERLERRIAARPLVVSDATTVPTVAARRAPDDLVVEPAGVDRGDRALMAAQRERVLLLARDRRLARVVLGDQPGREVDVGIAVDQRRVRRDLVAAHRHQAHRLGAAGDDRRRRTRP